jgi:cobalamin biosynthesis protein CobD/CbiB
MGRLLTTRRSEWLPGVALLCVAVGITALVGWATSTRAFGILVGVVIAVVLLAGWLERLLVRRHAQREVDRLLRNRSRLRVIEGGKRSDMPAADLEADDPDSRPRWLM